MASPMDGQRLGFAPTTVRSAMDRGALRCAPNGLPWRETPWLFPVRAAGNRCLVDAVSRADNAGTLAVAATEHRL